MIGNWLNALEAFFNNPAGSAATKQFWAGFLRPLSKQGLLVASFDILHQQWVTKAINLQPWRPQVTYLVTSPDAQNASSKKRSSWILWICQQANESVSRLVFGTAHRLSLWQCSGGSGREQREGADYKENHSTLLELAICQMFIKSLRGTFSPFQRVSHLIQCKPKRCCFDQNFLSTSCTVIWWWGWVATVATFCSKIRLPAPALLCSTWERELGVVARRDGRYCWCSVNQSLLFGQNVKSKSDLI